MHHAVSSLLFRFVCFHLELYLSRGTTSGTCNNSTVNHKTLRWLYTKQQFKQQRKNISAENTHKKWRESCRELTGDLWVLLGRVSNPTRTDGRRRSGSEPNTINGGSLWSPRALACSEEYAQDDVANQTFDFTWLLKKKKKIKAGDAPLWKTTSSWALAAIGS